VFLELLIIVVLILCSGALSMSELAVVSAAGAAEGHGAEGNKGAAMALKLAEDREIPVSAQIGISLIGVCRALFQAPLWGTGLPNFSCRAACRRRRRPLSASAGRRPHHLRLVDHRRTGPKQLALRDSEAVAARVAPAMQFIATIAAPLVFLLDIRVARPRAHRTERRRQDRVTDEEVKTIIARPRARRSRDRREAMISGVMRFADRSARGLMTLGSTSRRWTSRTTRKGDGDAAHLAPLYAAGARGRADQIIGVLCARI